MDLLPDFRDLLAEFARCGVEAVLVGGYAVALHGHPRSTKEHGSRARLDALITNKRATGRAQDALDAEALERVRASRDRR